MYLRVDFSGAILLSALTPGSRTQLQIDEIMSRDASEQFSWRPGAWPMHVNAAMPSLLLVK